MAKLYLVLGENMALYLPGIEKSSNPVQSID